MAAPLQAAVPSLQQPKPRRTSVHPEHSPYDVHPPPQQTISLQRAAEHFYPPAPTNAAHLYNSGVPPSPLTGPFPHPPVPKASPQLQLGLSSVNTVYTSAPIPPEDPNPLGAVQGTAHPVPVSVSVEPVPIGPRSHNDQTRQASRSPSPVRRPGKTQNRSRFLTVESSPSRGLTGPTKPLPPVANGSSSAYRPSRARSAPGFMSRSPNPFADRQPRLPDPGCQLPGIQPRRGRSQESQPATASQDSGPCNNLSKPSAANDSHFKQGPSVPQFPRSDHVAAPNSESTKTRGVTASPHKDTTESTPENERAGPNPRMSSAVLETLQKLDVARHAILRRLSEAVVRLKEEQEELQRLQKNDAEGRTISNKSRKSMTPVLIKGLRCDITLFQRNVNDSLSACEEQHSLAPKHKQLFRKMQKLGARLLTDCETLLAQACLAQACELKREEDS